MIKSITQNQVEELAKLYPTLFEKSLDDSFRVGQGWYPIIETVCGMICAPLDRAIIRLLYAKEKSTADSAEVAAWEDAVAKLKADIPTILYVKEKFGGLRFQMRGGTPEMHQYTAFATALSLNTCECCGASGKPRNTGWVKVLCDTHNKERNASDLEIEIDNTARPYLQTGI